MKIKLITVAGWFALAFSSSAYTGYHAVSEPTSTLLDQLCGGCDLTLVQSSTASFGLFGQTTGPGTSGSVTCNVLQGNGAAGHPFYVYEYQIFAGSLGPAANHCLGFDLLDSADPMSWDLDGSGKMSQVFSLTDSTVGNVAVVQAFQFGSDLEFDFGNFADPCGLVPGGTTLVFGFISPAPPGTVGAEVTDTYTDPSNGQGTDYRAQIQVLGPSVCDWWEPCKVGPGINPALLLQAFMLSYNMGGHGNLPSDGMYPMQFQLFDSVTNGNAISGVLTQQVNVVSGLLTVPLDFGANSYHPPQPCYLDVAIGTPGMPTFTHLAPRLILGQSPYAAHAAEADSVINLGAGQAVMSLNGLQDSVTLMAGNGVTITPTNNNTLIISAGVSTASAPSAQSAPAPSQTLEKKDGQIKALNERLATLEQETSARLAKIEKTLATLQTRTSSR